MPLKDTRRSLDRAGRFPATCWGLVAAATSEPDPAAAGCVLGEWRAVYWHPIYCYLRNRGNPPPDAQHLTQGFLADLIRRNPLAGATAERGKLVSAR